MSITKEVSLFLSLRLSELWNRKGFSMTEVMVGGAILAGIALSGARMFKDQRNAQKKLDLEQKLTDFHNAMVKVLHDPKNCNATLTSYYNSAGDKIAWNVAPPTTIYTCNTCTNTSMDWDANPTTIPAALKTAWIANGSWIENTNSQTTKGTSTWKITNMFWGAVPNATGQAVLKIEYSLFNTAAAGAVAIRSVYKDVNLNLRFTQEVTPRFRQCLSPNESSVLNLQKDICDSMAQISSTGTIMGWDDVTQKCIPKTNVKTCPAGTILEGIRADGSVHCQSIMSGIGGEDLMLSAPCAPGTSVNLEIVDGKVRTKCI